MLHCHSGHHARSQEFVMAKGQKKSNKEARKPKAEKKKTIAANPSQKTGSSGLENLKN
ncbi:MAG TPA: hypothetical protein VM913_03355 [Sphingomicrobium sp.]|nr:hypothetical protein [Sphingomicrobium sp.]